MKRKKPKKSRRRARRKLTRDLYLFSAIEPSTVKELIKDIIELRNKNKKIINLYIDSPGGYCENGWSLIDVMLQCQPIRTIILGEACSMAVPVALAGKKGQRYIGEHSFMMLHPVATGAHDYLSFAEARIKNAKVVKRLYDDFVLANSKMPKKVYSKAKNSELWLTAEESLKYGLADKLYKGRLR